MGVKAFGDIIPKRSEGFASVLTGYQRLRPSVTIVTSVTFVTFVTLVTWILRPSLRPHNPHLQFALDLPIPNGGRSEIDGGMMDPEEAAVSRKRLADTRRFARFDVLEYAMVYHPDALEPLRTVVVDVGLGGVQVLSRQQLQIGDICHVDLGKADGSRLTVPSEVRFSHPCNGSGLYTTGMRFVPETHEQKSEVVDFVHDVFRRQADQLSG